MTILDDGQSLLSDFESQASRFRSVSSEVDSLPIEEREYRVGDVIVKLHCSPGWEEPSWLFPAWRRLLKLQQLERGWDSYGALPVKAGVAAAAIQFLLETLDRDAPRPEIMPLPNGRLQIEWHEAGVDLEIEVAEHGPVAFYFCDLETGFEVEQRVFGNLRKIHECLRAIESPS